MDNTNTIAVTLPKEYEEQLFNQLLEINKHAMEQAKKEVYSPLDRYVTQTELYKLFKTGMKQIEEWRQKGLKCVKIGKSIRYDLQDVYELLEQEKTQML